MRQLKLDNVGEAIKDTDIFSAEYEMGINFPQPYINFLLEQNGGDMLRDLPSRNFFIRDFYL